MAPGESREEILAREVERWQNIALTLAEIIGRLRAEVRELRQALDQQAAPRAGAQTTAGRHQDPAAGLGGPPTRRAS